MGGERRAEAVGLVARPRARQCAASCRWERWVFSYAFRQRKSHGHVVLSYVLSSLLLATRRAVSRDRVTRSLETGSCVSFRCNSNRRRLPAYDVRPSILRGAATFRCHRRRREFVRVTSANILAGANIREQGCRGTLLHPDASALIPKVGSFAIRVTVTDEVRNNSFLNDESFLVVSLLTGSKCRCFLRTMPHELNSMDCENEWQDPFLTKSIRTDRTDLIN